MLTAPNPRLRRSDVVLDSFHSCIANTSKKLSGTPKVPFSEILPQPRMLTEKFKRTISFKQLKSSANTHRRRQLNEQMNVVNCDMQFINLTSVSSSCCINKSLAICPQSIKLKRIHRIFAFPDKVESVLPEGMFETFQFHFFPPQTLARNTVHTKFVSLFHGANFKPLHVNKFEKLNFMEDGNSSLCLKPEVPLPLM